MLQGVDPPPGLLDFRRHQLAGLFAFCQSQHGGEHRRQCLHRPVQVPRGKGEPIGEHIPLLGRAGVEGELGHLHAHDVFHLALQGDLLLGRQQSGVQHRVLHPGPGQHELLVGRPDARLHLQAQLAVFPHPVQKLPHQLIPLVFQQLVAPGGGVEFFLQAAQLHAGGVHL